MYVSPHATQMHAIYTGISNHWIELKGSWNDPISHLFEQQHWSALGSDFKDLMSEIEKLATVLANARRKVR